MVRNGPSPPRDPDSRGRTRSHRERQEAEYRIGWKMAGVGFEVAGQVAAGAILGWLYDRWRGTGSNTGILVGSVIGVVVGMWSLVKRSLALHRQLDEVTKKHAHRARPDLEERNSSDDDDTDDGQPDSK